ncbi:hypothetical protein F383_24111 [Gossypium arboreum]|uniref:Uncharacterized protein n=1 Tax=Gossypium arboreum TaxID=29729 RepID=A0A0B0MSB7_GOSAR|nr:hypothetical protein F383_24111 [Gossypium arboreum]
MKRFYLPSLIPFPSDPGARICSVCYQRQHRTDQIAHKAQMKCNPGRRVLLFPALASTSDKWPHLLVA